MWLQTIGLMEPDWLGKLLVSVIAAAAAGAAAAVAMYGARKWLAPSNRVRLYLEKLGVAQASELVALVAVLGVWTGLTLLYS